MPLLLPLPLEAGKIQVSLLLRSALETGKIHLHPLLPIDTAPNAGKFDITGSFADLQQSSVNLAILVDGVTAFNASFTGQSAYQGTIPFSIDDVSLRPGMTIDLAVGSDQRSSDVVGLMATISTASGNPHTLSGCSSPALTRC